MWPEYSLTRGVKIITIYERYHPTRLKDHITLPHTYDSEPSKILMGFIDLFSGYRNTELSTFLYLFTVKSPSTTASTISPLLIFSALSTNRILRQKIFAFILRGATCADKKCSTWMFDQFLV